jgi:hypothetical protein
MIRCLGARGRREACARGRCARAGGASWGCALAVDTVCARGEGAITRAPFSWSWPVPRTAVARAGRAFWRWRSALRGHVRLTRRALPIYVLRGLLARADSTL